VSSQTRRPSGDGVVSDAELAAKIEAALRVHSPAYSCYAAIELAETLMLSGDEAAAVDRLRLQAWLGIKGLPQGFLPADEKSLANMTGLGPKAWRKVKEAVLERYPEVGQGMRCHPGLVAHRLEQARRKANAAKGGLTKEANASGPRLRPTDALPTPLLSLYLSVTGQRTEDLAEPLPAPLPTGYQAPCRNGSAPPSAPATNGHSAGLPTPLPTRPSLSLSSSLALVGVDEGDPLSSSGGGNEANAAAAAAGRELVVAIQATLRVALIGRPLSASEHRRILGWAATGCPAAVVVGVLRRLIGREFTAGKSITTFGYFVPAIEECVGSWREGAFEDVDDDYLDPSYRDFVLDMLTADRWPGVALPQIERAAVAVRHARTNCEIEAIAGALPVPTTTDAPGRQAVPA
jgi:hypothetical protein